MSSTSRHFDLIIIGAGPAGATLARLLGGHMSILLVDSRNMDDEDVQGKCCGGLLAPDAREWLARLSLALPSSVLDIAQPLTVRALDMQSGDTSSYPRHYFNLNRTRFEKWLLSLLPVSVTRLYSHRCININRDGQKTTVTLKGAEGLKNYHAPLLVAADGAGSILRKKLQHPAASSYLAIQERYNYSEVKAPPPASSEYGALLHPQTTDFYGWIIPKHNGFLLGAAFKPDKRAIQRRWAAFKNALARYGYIFQKPAHRQGCQLLRPRPSDIFYGLPGVFCIGEAAGLISPSSAEGFSYAFASAQHLALALIDSRHPQKALQNYRANCRPLHLNIAWKRVKSYVMYTPTLRRLVMRSPLPAV